MVTADRASMNPWDWIYATRAVTTVGWYEPDPTMSRELVADAFDRGARRIIDVGGGASMVVDHALDLGFEEVAVVDISEAGLAIAQHRLKSRAADVRWIIGDVTDMGNIGTFDLWHDRAAFHFLLDLEARRAYAGLAARTVAVGGTAILATFAADGPERCSGMPVRRYDPGQLANELSPAFRLVDSRRYLHHTPAGVPQQFQYSTFERVAADRTGP